MSEQSPEDAERRRWECPSCGHTEDRHHASKTRPFCDKCDFRHAVLIEMVPKGKDSSKFYDEDGYPRNIPTGGDTA